MNALLLTNLLLAVIPVYWLLHKRAVLQNGLLLAASLFCYGWINPMYPIILLGVAAFAFGTARAIDRSVHRSQREGFLAMGVTFVGGSLLSLQYAGFNWAAGLKPLDSLSGWMLLQWMAPIGMAFYTLGLIGYLIEVKRGRMPAERNFLTFLTAVAFLPHLFLGPVPKHAGLLPQFRRGRRLEREIVVPSVLTMLWGIFKLVIIAGNLTPVVAQCFGHYTQLPGSALFVGTILLAVQVYAAFSGYSDFAAGSARLLGIQLTPDFALPLLSRTPAAFWRRWYVSVHTWLREYLFLPSGARTGSALHWTLTVLGVFLFAGIWYGTGTSFVLWALTNALLLIAFRAVSLVFRKPTPMPALQTAPVRFAAWVVTFHLTALSFVWFRATTPAAALSFYAHLFRADFFTAAPQAIARQMIWCVPLFAVEGLMLLKPDWNRRLALAPARITAVLLCFALGAGICFL